MADHADFLKWLDSLEADRKAAATASARMLQHQLFPMFCQGVGVPMEEWGKGTDLAMEVSLFEEWLAALPREAAPARVPGKILMKWRRRLMLLA